MAVSDIGATAGAISLEDLQNSGGEGLGLQRGCFDDCPEAALTAIDCDEAEWQQQLNAVRCGWRVIGGSVQMRELAQRIGQQRF